MKSVFFACSESSALDMQTNRISMFHAADSINIVSVPYFLNSIAAVAILERDEEDPEVSRCQLKISVVGSVLAILDIDIDFQGKQRCRSLGLFQGVMIPVSGDVTFHLLNREVIIAEWAIKVELIQPSSTQEPKLNIQEASRPRRRNAKKGKEPVAPQTAE